MIPLKIQLKNFLSYGSELQTIDFSPYQLICLSGKNGHGKSALLDAITWALWGQGRKTTGTAKADEGLLRLGQTQMFVSLDFEFNGQTYRVRREFAKTYGKPHAALDFGVFDAASGELISLTDKTARQTQAKIEAMLNLDVESFVNSAFLRQGHSNEFSKKSAKERKNVLATILGLNRYETIRARALEKVKQAQQTKEHLNTLQEKILQELSQKETLTAQIAALTLQLKTVETTETALQVEKKSLDATREALAKDQAQQQMLTFQLQQLSTREAEAQNIVRTTFAQWRAVRKKMGSLHEQERLEAQKKQLFIDLTAHQATLQKSLEIKEHLLKKKEESHALVARIKETLAVQLHGKKTAFDQLTIAATTIKTKIDYSAQQLAKHAQEQNTINQELVNIAKALTELAVDQNQLSNQEKLFERRKEYYQKFIAQGTWIKQELDALEQKNKLVHDDENPSCPLCDQNLSATRKRHLKNRFAIDEQFLKHRITRLKKVTIQLKAVLLEQHGQIAALKKRADDAKALNLKKDELDKRVATLTQAIKDETVHLEAFHKELVVHETGIAQARKEMDTLTAQEHQHIQEHNDVKTAQQAIKVLEQESAALNYNAQAHQTTQNSLQAVEKQLQEFAQLRDEIALQEQRKVAIAEQCAHLKKIKNEATGLHKALAVFHDLQKRIADFAHSTTVAQYNQDMLTQQKERLLQEKGGLEKQQQQLQKLELEHVQHVKMIGNLDTTIEDYQTIAAATGKDGIQALLIEEAIPEIEQEANQLLGKLTGNQAHIFIESLRDLKSGGSKETLDIKISDAVGIRPYEMFSGGEAFRIDFALRIAISKLLARRAGTSLQTLIIDEGFGSQDEEGLGTIMDALYKIQEDFAKVIIVSHLPTMKDQFPVHFVVEKGPNGSSIRVMEQG